MFTFFYFKLYRALKMYFFLLFGIVGMCIVLMHIISNMETLFPHSQPAHVLSSFTTLTSCRFLPHHVLRRCNSRNHVNMYIYIHEAAYNNRINHVIFFLVFCLFSISQSFFCVHWNKHILIQKAFFPFL